MRSLEEETEDWAKKQLKDIKFYTKTEKINDEIENALKSAPSKSGGTRKKLSRYKIIYTD